jgi:16S rRNA (cytosine1402-N4)-methyltransferase
MTDFHHPVMVDETIKYLISERGGTIVDLTCGGGGHLNHFAERLDDNAILVGIDRDPEAIAAARQKLKSVPQKLHLVNRSFVEIDEILGSLKIDKVNGFFMDLGVSSHQVDSPHRGFSFMTDGPLDMRMGPDCEFSAGDIVNTYTESQLARIFREYGEERRAVRVAREICRRRTIRPLKTTGDLTDTVGPVLSPKHRQASLARIFQALRIFINDEINQLRETLPKLHEHLSMAGRIVTLAYHSLEDRTIKRFMAERARGCICPPGLPACVCGRKPDMSILIRKVIKPSETEIAANVRARSARLRAAEKIEAAA